METARAVYLACRTNHASNVRFSYDYVCFTPESSRGSRWVFTTAFDPKMLWGRRQRPQAPSIVQHRSEGAPDDTVLV